MSAPGWDELIDAVATEEDPQAQAGQFERIADALAQHLAATSQQ